MDTKRVDNSKKDRVDNNLNTHDVVKSTKLKLIKITSEELKAQRVTAYKYLIP